MNEVTRAGRATTELPIGVFDSGVGGLTVLAALKAELPRESFIYLGDTARLPYGTKSRASIAAYATQAADHLVRRGIKCLVVACNTASAVALDVLARRYAPLPVIGVVEPGAEAGCRHSTHGRILVIATDSTVREGAYQRAILKRRPDAKVLAKACPLFVALAEEGWTRGPIVAAIAHRYLDELLISEPDTLVLGCTHFPVLRDVLREVVGPSVLLVDSAATTALALRTQLDELALRSAGSHLARTQFLATDGVERFARVGSIFLDSALNAADIELVDLQTAAEVPMHKGS